MVAKLIAGALIPATAASSTRCSAICLTMVLLPVPVLGVALLYFDIRRKRDGFTAENLRSDLAALRG